MSPKDCDPVIEVRGLRNSFGEQVVHDNLNLTVCPAADNTTSQGVNRAAAAS